MSAFHQLQLPLLGPFFAGLVLLHLKQTLLLPAAYTIWRRWQFDNRPAAATVSA